jgi:hypothetical protein
VLFKDLRKKAPACHCESARRALSSRTQEKLAKRKFDDKALRDDLRMISEELKHLGVQLQFV